jgi:serine/threonine-protein kinase
MRVSTGDAAMGAPTFGRYVPMFRIASGGMAEVYGAQSSGEAGFRKWVALKRMLPHLSEDPRFVEMFLDEGRLAANIHGPHVVSTVDLGRATDGSVFLVMDLVVGVTLSALLRESVGRGERLPVAVVAELIAQSALGLHDAHEARTVDGQALEIVHRDISPQNILVGVDGRARITDFGIARASVRETQTRTGEIKGKLSYFSPEQASMDVLDGRSDLFSLAVVAWESFAGRRLFHAENPLAILKNLTERPIPRLEDVTQGRVPPELAAVVHRGLERDRALRFPTGQDFALALRASLGGTGGLASSSEIEAVVRRYGAATVDKIQSGMKATSPLELDAAPSFARGGGGVEVDLDVSEAPTGVSGTRDAATGALRARPGGGPAAAGRAMPDEAAGGTEGPEVGAALGEDGRAARAALRTVAVALSVGLVLALGALVAAWVWWPRPGAPTPEAERGGIPAMPANVPVAAPSRGPMIPVSASPAPAAVAGALPGTLPVDGPAPSAGSPSTPVVPAEEASANTPSPPQEIAPGGSDGVRGAEAPDPTSEEAAARGRRPRTERLRTPATSPSPEGPVLDPWQDWPAAPPSRPQPRGLDAFERDLAK